MKLRAAVIGCGAIAGGYDTGTVPAQQVMGHARAYKNAGVELVAAIDADPEEAIKFAMEWGACESSSDLAILKNMRLDIVSICTPNETHFNIFRQVLPLGPRAIICEKPLSLELEEAAEMVRLAEQQGILLAVNYLRRWDVELIKLGQRILAGEWGKLQAGRGIYTKGVFHNASHGINLLANWLGPINGVDNISLERFDRDLRGDFSLDITGGGTFIFQYLDAANYNTFELDLYFEKARIRLPGGGASIEIYPAAGGRLAEVAILGPGSLHFAVGNMIQNVVDCLQSGSSLKMKPAEALDTVKICAELRSTLQEHK